jgi:anti-sigma factor RsiW
MRSSYGPLAAAASIALIISCAALVYLYVAFDTERGQPRMDLAAAMETADNDARELVDAKVALQRPDSLVQRAADDSQEIRPQLAVLQSRLAGLEAENRQLATENQAAEQAAAAAQRQLAAMESSVRDLEARLSTAAANTEELAELRRRSDWVAQVIGYHRLYAGNMHEVEIKTEAGLVTWLRMFFDREITVPDLSEFGMEFVGGRVFSVDGQPVGQIAYHDREGRLTGFCFKTAEDGEQTGVRFGQSGDLGAISWQKGGLDFVLVGFADLEKVLAHVAGELFNTYGDDI